MIRALEPTPLTFIGTTHIRLLLVSTVDDAAAWRALTRITHLGDVTQGGARETITPLG